MSLEFLNFVVALVLIIVSAKTAGYLSSRMGQPAVLGELLVGLLLGPTILDVLHELPVLNKDEHLLASIKLMAELGVVLLMFLAGLELKLSDLLRSGKVSALSGTLGVLVPLTLGWLTARLFGTPNDQAILVGLALSATSVSIAAQTLIELNVLRTRVGLALLGAAVFDDVLVILLLSAAGVLLAHTGGGWGSVAVTLLRMIAFLVGGTLLGFWLLPPLASAVRRLPISQGLIAFALCAVLFYAWAAAALGGVASITGAFLVGLFLGRTPYKDTIEEGIGVITYSFLAPIFFVDIGLEVNMRALGSDLLGYALVLTAVAILSKLAGAGLGALWSGFDRLSALRLGIGMVSRGEVGLIVAAFALNQGLLTADLFALVVFMIIIATLVTPPLLRAAYRIPDAKRPVPPTPPRRP